MHFYTNLKIKFYELFSWLSIQCTQLARNGKCQIVQSTMTILKSKNKNNTILYIICIVRECSNLMSESRTYEYTIVAAEADK